MTVLVPVEVEDKTLIMIEEVSAEQKAGRRGAKNQKGFRREGL